MFACLPNLHLRLFRSPIRSMCHSRYSSFVKCESLLRPLCAVILYRFLFLSTIVSLCIGMVHGHGPWDLDATIVALTCAYKYIYVGNAGKIAEFFSSDFSVEKIVLRIEEREKKKRNGISQCTCALRSGVLYRSPFKSIPFHESGVNNCAFISEHILLNGFVQFGRRSTLWLSTETEKIACTFAASSSLHCMTTPCLIDLWRIKHAKRNEMRQRENGKKLHFSSKTPHGAH